MGKSTNCKLYSQILLLYFCALFAGSVRAPLYHPYLSFLPRGQGGGGGVGLSPLLEDEKTSIFNGAFEAAAEAAPLSAFSPSSSSHLCLRKWTQNKRTARGLKVCSSQYVVRTVNVVPQHCSSSPANANNGNRWESALSFPLPLPTPVIKLCGGRRQRLLPLAAPYSARSKNLMIGKPDAFPKRRDGKFSLCCLAANQSRRVPDKAVIGGARRKALSAGGLGLPRQRPAASTVSSSTT